MPDPLAASAALRSDLARRIEHTLLKPEATAKDIDRLCSEAREHGIFGVCIAGCWISLAEERLAGSGVRIVSVIGFPHGNSLPEVKGLEAELAIQRGADEVDVVLNVGLLRSGRLAEALDDIQAVVEVAHSGTPRTVKVIIEAALLSQDQKVEACRLIQRAGADFVKTSTGFAASGATVEDVALLKRTVGERLGIKAAGGIRTLSQARAMLRAGATRLGCSASVDILREAELAQEG